MDHLPDLSRPFSLIDQSSYCRELSPPHFQFGPYRQLLGESYATLHSVRLHLSMTLVVGDKNSSSMGRLGSDPVLLGSLPRRPQCSSALTLGKAELASGMRR